MKCYLIERIDNVCICEDHSMVVIAKDEMHAERRSRLESEDFRKAKLKVTEISMDTEQVVLTADTGA